MAIYFSEAAENLLLQEAALLKRIIENINKDGIDRRGFLECMAWAGTGVVWTISGGIATSKAFGQPGRAAKGDLTFVQISDSHIGFNRPANPDVNGTLQRAVDKINALDHQPEFLIHTGDLSHTSKAGEFDMMNQILQQARTKQIFYVPGEHDVSTDDGKQYLERYGKGTQGRGWYSFDHKGVHFLGLVNVGIQEGLGKLGEDQLAWIEQDLKAKSASTPIIVFAHIPLWTVYQEWNWGTAESAQVLAALKRFGAVTVLNGHIHQVMQKVEGNVTFHTAMSTAFPQPAPGTAPAPGPMKVPDERLRSVLGITNVQYVAKKHTLATVDSSLEDGGKQG
jgi:3',5'-cyclic-AMP phosphodiesterase